MAKEVKDDDAVTASTSAAEMSASAGHKQVYCDDGDGGSGDEEDEVDDEEDEVDDDDYDSEEI